MNFKDLPTANQIQLLLKTTQVNTDHKAHKSSHVVGVDARMN